VAPEYYAGHPAKKFELLSLLMVLRHEPGQQYQKVLPMCLSGRWEIFGSSGSSPRTLLGLLGSLSWMCAFATSREVNVRKRVVIGAEQWLGHYRRGIGCRPRITMWGCAGLIRVETVSAFDSSRLQPKVPSGLVVELFLSRDVQLR
jgi:hypothetical protein